MPYKNPDTATGAADMSGTSGTSNNDAARILATAHLAQEAVAAMRRVLLTAEIGGSEIANMETCMPELEKAICVMRNLKQELDPGTREINSASRAPVPQLLPESVRTRLRRDLAQLRSDAAAVGRLAHSGATFCFGLARLLGITEAGYTQAGESAPLPPAGSLSLSGSFSLQG